MIRHPPRSTLFPYPPLSRSLLATSAISCGKPDPDKYQSTADQIMVIIPRGSTYYQALDSLESRGVIKSRDWFSLYARIDRKSTRLNSSHSQISYAVFCLKKK